MTLIRKRVEPFEKTESFGAPALSKRQCVERASDVAKRLAQHGGPQGAKFTGDHSGARLIYVEGPLSIALALQRERQLKRWSRAKKLALVQNEIGLLRKLSHSTGLT